MMGHCQLKETILSAGSGGAGPVSCSGERGGPEPPGSCGKRSACPAAAAEDPRAWSVVPEKETLCHLPAKLGHTPDLAAAAEPMWALGRPGTTGKEALAHPVPAPRETLAQDTMAVTAPAREPWLRPAPA
ncbi:UNVERIFIED_CONTAM: hypothetical protein K2H54_050765 [Gekko kuhli]